MSLLGPRSLCVPPVSNEQPGWDSSPSADMSFITLTLNGGNDEHFAPVISRRCTLEVRKGWGCGGGGVPSFNI